MAQLPTVDEFLAETLPDLDKALASDEMRIETRPLFAAITIARHCVMEVEDNGRILDPGTNRLEFLEQDWFRGIYQLTEDWYRTRYGESLFPSSTDRELAFIVALGLPFRIDVPMSVITPADPGRTVLLQMPDSLLSGEDPKSWVRSPPNFSTMSPQDLRKLEGDLSQVCSLLRSVASKRIGIPNSMNINRGLVHAVRGHLSAAANQVLDHWQEQGTSKAAWDLQMACECALKAAAQKETGTFRETHDLFTLFDDIPNFSADLDRNELKRLPRWRQMTELRYGQINPPRLGEIFDMYITALRIVKAGFGRLAVVDVSRAILTIQQPPWQVPFERTGGQDLDDE